MRALVWAALLVTGCGELLVIRAPPWAEDAQLVVIVLDAEGRPVEARPRLLRAGPKIEVTIPPGQHETLVVYEYSAAQKAADGISLLADCGATFEDSGAAHGDPIAQYRSELLGSDDAEAVALSPSNAPLVPVHQVECNLDPCAMLDTDDLYLPVQANLTAVAAIADRDVVVASAIGGEDPEIVLYRVEARAPTQIPIRSRVSGSPAALVYDGIDTLYGTAEPTGRSGGNLFAIELDGDLAPVPELSLGFDNKTMARGMDGSIFVGGEAGLFEVVAGSTIAIRVDGFPTGVDQIGVARRDRLVVADRQQSLYFYDGHGWRAEWVPYLADTTRIYGIAVDDEQAVAVGTTGAILVRDEATRTWAVKQGPPKALGVTLLAVALLSKSRFVIAFDGGGVAIWNGKAWCETLEPLGKSRIVRFDTSPSREQVFGVSDVEPVVGPKLQTVEALRR